MARSLQMFVTLVTTPLSILYYTIYMIFYIIVAFIQFLVLLLQNLPLLLFSAGIIAVGFIWFGYSSQIITMVDVRLRCDFVPWYKTNFQQLVDTLGQVWVQVICWINAIAHWNRFFTGYFLGIEFAKCSTQAVNSQGGYFDALKQVFINVATMVSILAVWIFTGLFTQVLPIFNFLDQLVPTFMEVDVLLNCVCNDLRPVFDFVTRVATNPALYCLFHYYGNAAITIFQQVSNYSWNFASQLFIIIFDGGSFNDLVNLLFRETTSLGLPDLTFALERANSGAINLGAFLDNFLLIAACTIASEIDGNMNTFIIYPAYASCYNNQVYHVPFFTTILTTWSVVIFPSWEPPSSISATSVLTSFTPTVSLGYRTINFIYNFIVNWFRVWDPNQNFLENDLTIDRILDSLRDPPTRMGTTSTIWTLPPNASLIQQYNAFGIPLPAFINNTQLYLTAQTLYGNNFNATPGELPPTCNGQYSSYNQTFTSVPCLECNIFGNFSFQYRLCVLGQTLDNLVFGQTGASLLSNGDQRQIFQPILCCIVGRSLRVGIALLNYPIGMIRNWNNFPAFLEDDRYIQSIFDEIGGPQDEFAGFVQCIYNFFFYVFDPRLRCIAGIVAYISKAGAEILRSIFIILPRVVATIRGSASQQTLNLFNYFCLDTVSEQDCFGVESAIQWLRIPRMLPSANYTDPEDFTATVAYRPILPPNSIYRVTNETFTECLCNVINLQFISAFLGFDILDGIDLCCGFQFAVRAAAELVKLGFQIIIIIIETVLGYVDIVDGKDTEGRTFLVLEWLACSPANIEPITNPIDFSDFYCSNIPDLTSDLEDFLVCPCVFFLDLEAIVLNSGAPPTDAFDCLCTLTSSIAYILLSLFRFLQAFALGLIKIVSCIIKDPNPFGNTGPPDCVVELGERFIESFQNLNQTLNAVDTTLQSVGCLIGTVFGFANNPSGQCLIGTVPPCLPPSPVNCFVGDKLGLVFFDLSAAIVSVIQAFLNIIIGLLQVALVPGNTGTSVIPLSFVQFLQDLIQGVVVHVWGDPPSGTGFLQDFGYFMNCVFGPIGGFTPCTVGSLNCAGAFFITVGNQLQFVWGDPNSSGLSCIIFNFLFFLETMFLNTRSNVCKMAAVSAGPECAQKHLLLFIHCLFKLIFDLLFSPQNNIFNFFFEILEAIAGLIPVIGPPIVQLLKLANSITQFFIRVGLLAVEQLICFITTGNPFNDGQCDATSGSKKRSTGESDGMYETLKQKFGPFWDNIKRNLNARNQFGTPVNFTNTLFNETETWTLSTPENLLSTLDNSSFCYRLLSATIFKYQSLQKMPPGSGNDPQTTLNISPSEEVLFKLCYGAVTFPYFYNAMSRTVSDVVTNNPDSISSILQPSNNNKKRNVEQDSPPPIIYQYGTIPYDVLHNPITGLTLFSNIVGAFGYYVQWKQQNPFGSAFSPSTKSYISGLTIDHIGSPIDLQNETMLDNLFYSDPEFITSVFNNNNTMFMKRDIQQQQQGSTMDQTILDNLHMHGSFGDFLKTKGIDCPYTEAFMKSIDNLHVQLNALSLVNLKSSSYFTTLHAQYMNQMNQTSWFFPSSKRSTSEPLLNPARRIMFSYAQVFQNQYNLYKNIMRGFSQYRQDGIDAWINFSTSNMNAPIRLKPYHPTKTFKHHHLLSSYPSFTSFGPELERPPIYILEKNGGEPRKRFTSFPQYGPMTEKGEIRVPIIAMANYIYRQSNRFITLYRNIGRERMRRQYENRPKDHWTVFTKEYILKKAADSPTGTSRVESMYAMVSGIVNQFGYSTHDWRIHQFVEEIREERIRRSNHSETMKRFLLNNQNQGALGCLILDDFISNTQSIFNYCSKRYYQLPDGTVVYNASVYDSLPHFQGLPIDVVPFNNSAPSTLPSIVKWFYSLVGYDVEQSVVNIVTNFNFNPNNGNIGIPYFFAHVPFIGICIRGVDDNCTFGVGIEKALIVTLILVIIWAFICIFFAPLGTGLTNIIVFFGGFLFIVNIFFTIAFGYNMACGYPQGSSLVFGVIIPASFALPALPECAGPEFARFFDSLVNSTCLIPTALYPLLKNGTCVTCNASSQVTSELNSCSNYGFGSFFWPPTILVNDLYTLVPSLFEWLNQTCWVRGGCLSVTPSSNMADYNRYGYAKKTGILSSLVPSSSFTSKIGTNQSNINDACLAELIPSRIALYFLLIAVLGFILWIGAVVIFQFVNCIALSCGQCFYVFQVIGINRN